MAIHIQTRLECLGHLKWRLFLKGKEEWLPRACDKVRGATKLALNLVSLMEV